MHIGLNSLLGVRMTCSYEAYAEKVMITAVNAESHDIPREEKPTPPRRMYTRHEYSCRIISFTQWDQNKIVHISMTPVIIHFLEKIVICSVLYV